MSLQAMYTANRGLVINRVNKLSEQSSHLIISSLVIVLVFTYMFVHPTSINQFGPIVAMIVGHFFGVQTRKNDDTK